MTTATRRARIRAAYITYMPALVLFLFIASFAGIVVGVFGIYQNNRQDAEAAVANAARDQAQAELLDCFDEFASELAGSLPPVRAASSERDDATGARDDALQLFVDVLIDAVADPKPTPEAEAAQLERFADAVTALDETGTALDEAQTRLERVRAENPYPPPPSTFCGVRGDG